MMNPALRSANCRRSSGEPPNDGNTTLPEGATYEVISSPFADTDQTPCMLATLRNVTQQKQIQLELIRLNQLRSEVLAQITKDLDQTSQEVVRLQEEKRRFVRFLSAVVHDLRAPLAVTQSCLWTILEGYTGEVNDEQKDLLQRGTRRINDLMALVDDLLDIPRIESGQLVHEMQGLSAERSDPPGARRSGQPGQRERHQA